MELDVVGKDVVSIPFVRVLSVEEGISQDVAILWVLQTVKLIKQHSLRAWRSRYVVND